MTHLVTLTCRRPEQSEMGIGDFLSQLDDEGKAFQTYLVCVLPQDFLTIESLPL